MSSSPDAQKHKLSAAGNVFLWGLIVWLATQVPGVLLLKHNIGAKTGWVWTEEAQPGRVDDSTAVNLKTAWQV